MIRVKISYRQIAFVSLCSLIAALVVILPITALRKKMTSTYSVLDDLEIPVHWDKDYTESASDYEQMFAYDNMSWDTITPDDTFEQFQTVNIDVDIPPAEFSFAADGYDTVTTHNQTAADVELATMTENEAWEYVTNGLWTSYPKTSFSQNKDKLVTLQNTNTETITVRVWYWANPKDDTNMNKVTKEKTFAVNSKLARTFEHIFQDIYEHPSRPVINIGDSAMGTWVLRGKNHNSSKTMSAHSLGVAIDINPSSGSFYVNGKWYGNAYGQSAMPESIWKLLPETHDKYHVLYNGCPIVEVFKSYGFYWGGDWRSGTDSMHLSYLGDGSSARETGIENYEERK